MFKICLRGAPKKHICTLRDIISALMITQLNPLISGSKPEIVFGKGKKKKKRRKEGNYPGI